jgi:hypothetical protein
MQERRRPQRAKSGSQSYATRSSGECFRAHVSLETDLGMRQSERRERIKADPYIVATVMRTRSTRLHRLCGHRYMVGGSVRGIGTDKRS